MKNEIKHTLNCAEQLINLIPNKGTPIKVVFCAYFISLFETVKDILIFFENNRYNNIPILTRLFLETYIDFKLLIKDPENIQSLILKSDKEELKKIKGLIEENTKKENSKLLSNQLIFLENEILSRKNIVKFSNIKDKFKELDLLWLYNTVYNELCGHSHNEIKKVEKKHILMKEQLKIDLINPESQNNNESYLSISVLQVYFTDAVISFQKVMNLEENSCINHSKVGK